MNQDQLARLESLRDRLIDTAVVDADPANWVASGKKPGDMTREERGDAKWCRSLATSTVALAMQVQRLLSNPATGGAMVPDVPAGAPPVQPQDEEATVEAEIQRYEKAASAVIDKHRRPRNGKP
jgi:hypothetical protein